MKLQKKTIERALESSDKYVVQAAIKNCAHNRNIDPQTVADWRESDSLTKNAAIIYANHQARPTEDFIKKLDKISKLYGYNFARELLARAYCPGTNLWFAYPSEVYGEYYSKNLVKNGIKMPISTKKIKDWIASDKWYDQISALYYCQVDPLFIPGFEILELFKKTMDNEVIDAAVEAIRAKELPGALLQKLYDGTDSVTKRIAVTKMFYGRTDITLDFDPEALSDDEIKALAGVNVSRKRVDSLWGSSSERAQAASIYLSKGKDMPMVFFGKAIRSSNPLLYEAGAVATYKLKGYRPYRDVMPKTVYKKCVGDVIVRGTMLSNSSIRKIDRNQGRTDQLFVEEIIGDFFGEKVGISFYDGNPRYYEQKSAIAQDFDPSFKGSTAGIHFFTEEKEARKFYY